MNKQEIFNKVWNHFIVERNPLSMENGTCLYRGPNGEKCAIGLFIPDELYHPSMEGSSLKRYDTGCPIVCALLSMGIGNFDILDELQHAHDNATSLESLKRKLEIIAEDFDLEVLE